MFNKREKSKPEPQPKNWEELHRDIMGGRSDISVFRAWQIMAAKIDELDKRTDV